MAALDLQATLELQHAIVQGPFGGGLSSATLTAAVSNLGGLGSYGVHHLAPDQIAAVAADIRARTSRPFALNLWVSTADPDALQMDAHRYERHWRLLAPYFAELGLARPEPPERFHQDFEAQAEALLATAPAVFSFVFGVPRPEILQHCRQRGILTIGAATSIAEGEALAAAGVDAIVASGFEAGGHRPSFLARAEESLMGTLVLVPLLADRVHVPVIAAGGIVDARGVRAVSALGAQAAQVGTAFLACEESAAPLLHREQLFSPAAAQTVLTRSFSGRLARGLRNRWTEELATAADIAPYPVQTWLTGQMRSAALAQGRSDLVSLWSGQGAPNLRHRRAADLMAALVS